MYLLIVCFPTLQGFSGEPGPRGTSGPTGDPVSALFMLRGAAVMLFPYVACCRESQEETVLLDSLEQVVNQ